MVPTATDRDWETKKWIAEIEAEKRRDKFYGKKRDNED